MDSGAGCSKSDVEEEGNDEGGAGDGESPPQGNGGVIGGERKGKSSPKSAGSSSNSNLEGITPPPPKGYGLKKWRRIRRDSSKEASGNADSSQVLKRRLSANEPTKGRGGDEDGSKEKDVVEGEPETPTPSVGSLRSVEAVDAVALDPELVQLVTSSGFAIGADSDNSEDRSSKSTAASVPKPRHETGFGRERGRTKSIGGRAAGSILQQRSQRGRGGGLDATKKVRGDRIRLEKENSQSSVESDLRSLNMDFMRWGSGVSNGKQSEKSPNFDGENGYEAQTLEEVGSTYYKENGVAEDLLGGDLDPDLVKEEHKVRRKNYHPTSGIDPFVESIIMLQAAQEALETEIQKIGEIRKATELDDLDELSEEAEVSSSSTLESRFLELNQKIEHLQHKLEEALATAKAKELKVLELEDTLNRTQTSKNELEEIVKRKLQAEVEYLVLTRTTQNMKILAEDHIALIKEQKSRADGNRLRDSEDKAINLKKQGELQETVKVMKLKNKACKFSFFLLVQLLLFCVTFGLFLIQLEPPSHDIVPT